LALAFRLTVAPRFSTVVEGGFANALAASSTMSQPAASLSIVWGDPP